MGFGSVKIYGRIEFEEINWEVVMVWFGVFMYMFDEENKNLLVLNCVLVMNFDDGWSISKKLLCIYRGQEYELSCIVGPKGRCGEGWFWVYFYCVACVFGTRFCDFSLLVIDFVIIFFWVKILWCF
jgi:hypothetical protein